MTNKKNRIFDLKVSNNGSKMICESQERTYKLDPNHADKILSYSKEWGDVFQRVYDDLIDGDEIEAGDYKELIYNLKKYEGDNPKSARMLANRLEQSRLSDPKELANNTNIKTVQDNTQGQESQPEQKTVTQSIAKPIQKLAQTQTPIVKPQAQTPVQRPVPTSSLQAQKLNQSRPVTQTPSVARPAPASVSAPSAMAMNEAINNKPISAPKASTVKAPEKKDSKPGSTTKVTAKSKETPAFTKPVAPAKPAKPVVPRETKPVSPKKPVAAAKVVIPRVKEEKIPVMPSTKDVEECEEYENAETEAEEKKEHSEKNRMPQINMKYKTEAFVGNRINAIMQNEAFLNRLMEQMKVPQFIAEHEKKTGRKLNESQLKTYYTKVVTEFVSKTNNRFSVIGRVVNEQLLNEFDPRLGDPDRFKRAASARNPQFNVFRLTLVSDGQWEARLMSSEPQGHGMARFAASNLDKQIRGTDSQVIFGVMPVGQEPRSPSDPGFENVSQGTMEFDDYGAQSPDPDYKKPTPSKGNPPPLPQMNENLKKQVEEYSMRLFENGVKVHYITEYVTAVEYATKLFEKQNVVLNESEIKVFAGSFSKKKLT